MKLGITEKKENIGALFFKAGVVCELLAGFSGLVECGPVMPYIILLGMACFAVKILFTMDLKKDIWLFLVFGLYGAVCYYFQNSALILRIGLILIAGRDRDSLKVLKAFFIGSLIVTGCVMLLSALGLKGELSVTRRFRGYDEETRYCFGFLHPNSFALMAFKILLLYFYAYFDRLRWWCLITVSAVVMFFLYLSGSVTGLMVTGFVIILTAFIKLVRKGFVTRLLYIAGNVGISFLVLFSAYVMFFYDGKLQEVDGNYVAAGFLEPINQKFFHGRLSVARQFYREYGISAFGMDRNSSTAENGFISGAINQGYIFIILYLITAFYLFYRFYRAKNNMGLVLIMAVMLYSFMESFIPYANKNLILLAGIGILLGRSNEQHLQKE